MNSEPSTPPLLSNQPITPATLPSVNSNNSYNDAPLSSLLEEPLVHEMTPEQLAAYVQRCNVLRQSAQTRQASYKTEDDQLAEGKPKRTKKPKENNVTKALAALQMLLPKT